MLIIMNRTIPMLSQINVLVKIKIFFSNFKNHRLLQKVLEGFFW